MQEIKSFKTIDQLIELLKERNVAIPNDDLVKNYLLGHSYYAVVNGYKDPFIDQEKTKELGHDYYRDGTHFNYFQLMYSVDSMLRDHTRSILLEAETIMKNATIYAFCYCNREVESYLDPASYCSKNEYHPKKRYTSSLIKLLNTLQRNHDNSQKKGYIDHYLKKHGYVPLWVLENALTFGNMSAFFDLQKTKVQNYACRNVEKISELEHHSIGIKEMREAYHVLSQFRNICAHEERLYCARVGRNKYCFADMFRCLQNVLSEGSIKDYAYSIKLSTLIIDPFPEIKKLVFDAMGVEESAIDKLSEESDFFRNMQ